MRISLHLLRFCEFYTIVVAVFMNAQFPDGAASKIAYIGCLEIIHQFEINFVNSGTHSCVLKQLALEELLF